MRDVHGTPIVLIVVDHPSLAEVVHLALRHGGVQAIMARDVADADAQIVTGRPHLAILDADSGDGAVLEHFTPAGHDDRFPILALTRRGDLATKLLAFERGVDDIVTVPFSPEELVARVLAIMRRTYGTAVALVPVIQIGELRIDMLHRKVLVGEHDIHLTWLEQSLLYLMAANAGRLLTRDEIVDHLWGTDYAAESNVVDRHVRNLRAKLQDNWRRPRYIATVPGKGYRFIPATDYLGASTVITT